MVQLFAKLCTVEASAQLAGKCKHKYILCLCLIGLHILFRRGTGRLGTLGGSRNLL